MRGQFSLRMSGAKKPWKIDTDYYVDNQEFHNLRQLMFLNNIGDSSLLYEKLAYEMMYAAGLLVTTKRHVSYDRATLTINVDRDSRSRMLGASSMPSSSNMASPVCSRSRKYRSSSPMAPSWDLAAR